MYEQEAESDDDCEVYFLKPVNEYNIVDKIKEANKELFADSEPEPDLTDNVDNEAAANRKVTFALNLEDYEPVAQHATTATTTTTTTTAATTTRTTNSVNTEINELELKFRTTELQCMTIIEEQEQEEQELTHDNEIVETTPEASSSSSSSSSAATTTITTTAAVVANASILDVNESDALLELDALLEDEEEITEEIIVMDMECERAEQVAEQDDSHVPMQNRIIKQATFDYEEEQDDNKSLTNLFPASDCEYEADETPSAPDMCDQPIYAARSDQIDHVAATAAINDEDDSDDDDSNDDLSIIVASYLPDDFELNNYTAISPTDATSGAKSKERSFFSAKGFSFRRLVKQPLQKQQPQPGLKLNYKTCCEYRNALQEKLPKYTGYLSEYGLSRAQLQRRNEQSKRKQRHVLEQTLQANEDDLRKMKDNERAFTTWLKNKMRYPINKTRNMFDVKLRRGSMVGTTINSCNGCHNNGQQHQQQQQQPHHCFGGAALRYK